MERLPALMQVRSLGFRLSAEFATICGFSAVATFLHLTGLAALLDDRKATWTGIGQGA